MPVCGGVGGSLSSAGASLPAGFGACGGASCAGAGDCTSADLANAGASSGSATAGGTAKPSRSTNVATGMSCGFQKGCQTPTVWDDVLARLRAGVDAEDFR